MTQDVKFLMKNNTFSSEERFQKRVKELEKKGYVLKKFSKNIYTYVKYAKSTANKLQGC